MKCVKCGREETAKWYSPKTNPTCATCYRKEYVAKNRDKVGEYYKQYNAKPESVARRKNYENTEKGKAARKRAEKAYYSRNPEKMKAKRDNEAQRQRLRNHYRNNKGYYKEKSARRTRQLEAASLNCLFIEDTIHIYETCPLGYEVDHIVPLIGKAMFEGKYQQVVCGLHVPWNLQHLSMEENRQKNCKL